MTAHQFRHPIAFRYGQDRIIAVASVEEAIEFLDCRWPEEGDRLYLAARSACLEALSDPRATERARHRFADALGEAGLDPATDFSSVTKGWRSGPMLSA